MQLNSLCFFSFIKNHQYNAVDYQSSGSVKVSIVEKWKIKSKAYISQFNKESKMEILESISNKYMADNNKIANLKQM